MMRLLHLPAMVGRIPVLWRALAAIAVLSGGLFALVESRAAILRSGAEIRLRTVPVDPRDLFRGDYVVLNYEITTVKPAAGQGEFKRGDPVHVLLRPGPDGLAQAVGGYKDRPPAATGDAVILGRVTSVRACALGAEGRVDCKQGNDWLRVAYGLESYFVPQGTGRAIETTDRKRLEIVAAVAGSGQAAIKRLLIDGKLVHAEPPY